MLYHIKERWGAGSGWYMPYVVFNANTPYIASVIYRPVSHSDTRVYGHPSNIGGWGATVDGSIDIDAQWKMHRIDRNFGATVGDNRFYHMHTPSATLGQTIIIDITNSQIEQKSNVTPFVNSTRSATQGLLSLVGTNTIDLTNVSFNSNAQMVFDGTNDYIDVGSLGIIGSNYSIECIFNSSAVTSYRNIFDMNYETYSGVTGNVGPRLEQITGEGISIIWSGVINNNNLYNSTNIYSITPNTNYYIMFAQNGTRGLLYVNGMLYDQANNINGYVQNFGDVNLGRGFSLDGSRYFTGNIPVFKIYNRALTAQEVRQNYQQYKTRFNLS
jgi:hypothetical protein